MRANTFDRSRHFKLGTFLNRRHNGRWSNMSRQVYIYMFWSLYFASKIRSLDHCSIWVVTLAQLCSHHLLNHCFQWNRFRPCWKAEGTLWCSDLHSLIAHAITQKCFIMELSKTPSFEQCTYFCLLNPGGCNCHLGGDISWCELHFKIPL